MNTTLSFTTTLIGDIHTERKEIIKNVREQDVYHFPEGIPAFEDIKDYVFIATAETHPFLYMQSITEPDLCFVCVDPFTVCGDFKLVIPDVYEAALEIDASDDLLILSLVTVRGRLEDVTANLMHPIVINTRTRCGMQIIPTKSEYPVRYRIWDAIEEELVELRVS